MKKECNYSLCRAASTFLSLLLPFSFPLWPGGETLLTQFSVPIIMSPLPECVLHRRYNSHQSNVQSVGGGVSHFSPIKEGGERWRACQHSAEFASFKIMEEDVKA